MCKFPINCQTILSVLPRAVALGRWSAVASAVSTFVLVSSAIDTFVRVNTFVRLLVLYQL